jgi:xylose isomerase
MSDYFSIGSIAYEGPDSRNPLAFRHYHAEELVEGKPMREHLRFAAPYWHVMRNALADPFGSGTALMPWDDGSNSIENALRRVDVFFEFLDKLGLEYYCWHDRDLAPELEDLQRSHEALDAVVARLKLLQEERGKKLLWGTACLFAHPRYAQGAATSPDLSVYAYAAAQVRKAIACTHELGGMGYTFWGGREGYGSLINTDLRRELDHLAAFLRMAVDYKQKIGFAGPFYIEPKPCEPSTHQYDRDVATCLNFLRTYDLTEHFRLNIETNHAELAGHTMEHELRMAAQAGMLGSIDANRGDPLLGWDTDQFPNSVAETAKVMLVVLGMGGFTTGGLNFDAKRRRESHEPEDLFHAFIGGMDTYAHGLKVAAAIRADGSLAEAVQARYSSFDSEAGLKIERGEMSLEELEAMALEAGEPVLASARQEMLENLFNRYL